VTSHVTKKRKTLSAVERQTISRQRKKDGGKTQVSLWLPSEIIAEIDKLKSNGLGRSELVEEAVKHWLRSDESRPTPEDDKYEGFGSW